MANNLLVDVKEASRLLSISRSKFYDLHNNCPSFPPLIKIGRKSLINFDKLVRWVSEIGN